VLLETYFGKRADESVWRSFDAMKTASALRESMWGMISELYLNAPGVDYVGPVPAEFDQRLVFTAAVGAKAKEPQAANEFIRYLTSPAAIAVMKANGLDAQQPR